MAQFFFAASALARAVTTNPSGSPHDGISRHATLSESEAASW